jgi:hypothetical protein
MNRYIVSVLDNRTNAYRAMCQVDAINKTEARVKAYRLGAIRHEQFDNSIAELKSESVMYGTGTPQ